MTKPMDTAVDLTNCDREPIHIPGSIQTHGCLIVCDAKLAHVLRHSTNARSFLGLDVAELNGQNADAVFGSRAAHDLRNALNKSSEPSRPGILIGYELRPGQHVDVAVHAFKGNVIVEFERSGIAQPSMPLEIARMMISKLRSAAKVEDLFRLTPRVLRGILGYDRVMLYRFGHDGSGRVVGEAKRSDLESFQGQHFPASDIPRQARELYLKNTIRVISNAAGEYVPIDPATNSSGEPLDLSFAHLRSVSPIHCEYLRNMGVDASMSISIIVGGELWGLIACHHYAQRILAMPLRIAAELFGEFFSMHLDALLQKQRLDAAGRVRQALDRLLSEMSSHDNVDQFLREHLHEVSELIPCDGVGLWLNGTFSGYGVIPPATAISSLARFINVASEGRTWATHELSRHAPNAEPYRAEASGVLAVPLSQIPQDYLMFFRKEVLQTIEWAGNPDKVYSIGPFGDRLTPRKSFAIWKETVDAQSLPWSEDDREMADAIRTALLEVIMRQVEVLSAERKKADVRQKMLNEELNHRVKNVLALIKSLVSQPVDEGRSIEEYTLSLKRRILALAHAHDQVIRNDGGGALLNLLEAELSPYKGNAGAITLDGPPVGLDARAYSVMALVLHELATNAAKYGALSVTGGQLCVSWKFTDERGCELLWKESSGPEVHPPRRQGFGTVLIHRSVPFDLNGESQIDYAPDGLNARFFIPAKFVGRLAAVASIAREDVKPEALKPNALSGIRIMLVEDQLVIAMEAESIFAQHGAKSVDTAATAREALRLLQNVSPDIAVLDVNLGLGTSLPVAEELQKRGIPFIFATGYGDNSVIPASMSSVPVVKKPYEAETLLTSLPLAALAHKIS